MGIVSIIGKVVSFKTFLCKKRKTTNGLNLFAADTIPLDQHHVLKKILLLTNQVNKYTSVICVLSLSYVIVNIFCLA